MKLNQAINKVSMSLVQVMEDCLGRDSEESKELAEAWKLIWDHMVEVNEQRSELNQTLCAIYSAISNTSDHFQVSPKVSPSESTPQNEYSIDPGIEWVVPGSLVQEVQS